ncbi:MAG: hypothetical protein HY590_01045 [Candidatus Omnitrophica bacterium]|nr:hypothetical protein [Candidatus Omnitrophota bacterium]
MEGKKQKILILFALCLVVMGVWSRVLLKKRVLKMQGPPQTEERAFSGRSTSLSSRSLRKLQEGKMVKEWNRNPFLAIGKEKEATYLSGLSLTGILWDKDRPLAMINNVVVSVHDTIDSYTIKEIASDAVVLERDGEEYVLRLGAK